MKIDPCTYGVSPAAITLALILERQDLSTVHKVGRIWIDYTTGLKDISKSNLIQKKQILQLWKDANLSRCNNSNLTNEVKCFLSNIMVTKFKMWLKGEIV